MAQCKDAQIKLYQKTCTNWQRSNNFFNADVGTQVLPHIPGGYAK